MSVVEARWWGPTERRRMKCANPCCWRRAGGKENAKNGPVWGCVQRLTVLLG